MPLTEQQRNALPIVRANFSKAFSEPTVVESVDQRARQPNPADLPVNVTARIEIAPPSPELHPLLNTRAPRTPERVPIYFYALQDDQGDLETADTHVIFFIHGGGNKVGHPTHSPFIQFFGELLRAAAARSGDTRKCVLIAPCYRLATVPENAFPAALQDLVAAYDYVLGKGYKSSNIVLAGDSAGGNHAIVLNHLVLRSDRSPPRAVVAVAPFSILAPDLISDYAKEQASNDLIDLAHTDQLANAYIGDSGLSSRDPLISGAFVPIDVSWPKTLILVGSADQIIDGSRELAKRLADAQRPVELVEYDERPHGWWVLPQIFSEDVQDAARRIAQYVFH